MQRGRSRISLSAIARAPQSNRWGGRAYTDLDDMLERESPDAVWVCVTPDRHASLETTLIARRRAVLRRKAAGQRPRYRRTHRRRTGGLATRRWRGLQIPRPGHPAAGARDAGERPAAARHRRLARRDAGARTGGGTNGAAAARSSSRRRTWSISPGCCWASHGCWRRLRCIARETPIRIGARPRSPPRCWSLATVCPRR